MKELTCAPDIETVTIDRQEELMKIRAEMMMDGNTQKGILPSVTDLNMYP